MTFSYFSLKNPSLVLSDRVLDERDHLSVVA